MTQIRFRNHHSRLPLISSNDTSYRNSNAVAVLVITILHEGNKNMKRTRTHLDSKHLEGADTCDASGFGASSVCASIRHPGATV